MRQGIGYRGFINLIIQENLILSLILQTIKTNDSKTVDNNTPGASSIVSVGKADIKIYPNPTKDYVDVELINGGSEINGLIEVYDNLGKLVMEERMVKAMTILNFRSIKAGMYILRIESCGEMKEVKIVKEL